MKIRFSSVIALCSVVGGTAYWWGVVSQPELVSGPYAHTEKDPKTLTLFSSDELALVTPEVVPKPTVLDNREGRDDPAIVTYEYEQAQISAEELSLVIESEPESLEKQAKIQSMMQAVLNKAKRDSNSLKGILHAYQADPDSIVGSHLQSILAEIPDPEVEATALALASSGDSASQLAGLDLLAQLNIPSRASFDTTLDIIALNDNSPEVLMAAVAAMPKIALPDYQLVTVIQNLSTLAENNSNEGVRSSSLFALGSWAKDVEDLKVVIDTLTGDRPADDRISASMALKESQVVDDQIRIVLVDRMSDPNELWEIRRMAAESLNRFKLGGQDFAAYQSFIEEQGDLATGE